MATLIPDRPATQRSRRSNAELEHLPVILMSSVPRPSIDESSIALASAFLRKPFNLEPLLETIRQLTGGRAPFRR